MTDILEQTFLVIGVSFAAVAVLARLRVSPIVGYLAAGLLLGPTGFGLLSARNEGAHFLGELGIALLMFVIGLEFSLPRLVAAGRSVVGLGVTTLLATATLAACVAVWAAGIPIILAAIVGGAVAMSSTAIVHKHLIDADQTGSRHGIAAAGIVLFEDVAALILLAMVSALQDRAGPHGLEAVLLRLGVGLAVFAAVALLARRTVGRLLEWVARTNVNEVFLLAVFTLIVGASLVAQSIGLSLPLGAFVVGMIIGESDFRHQLEEEIRPFRDLLVGIFFITVGMSVDWNEIAGSPGMTAAILAAIVGVKLLVVSAVTRLSGMRWGSALRTGLLLAHSGELGLLVVERRTAYLALPSELHPFRQYAASTTLTRALSPASARSRTRCRISACSNRALRADRSSVVSFQKRFPIGIVGSTPSMRSFARWRHFRPAAIRRTDRTTAGSGGSSDVLTVSARTYPSIIASIIRAVVTPGRSELRAAVSRERPSRMRSCAGLPMIV